MICRVPISKGIAMILVAAFGGLAVGFGFMLAAFGGPGVGFGLGDGTFWHELSSEI